MVSASATTAALVLHYCRLRIGRLMHRFALPRCQLNSDSYSNGYHRFNN